MTDWNSDLYSRFAAARLRPAMDLLSQTGQLPDGPVVDLGCGTGVMGEALAARHPGHRLIGVDNSPAMLAKARSVPAYDTLLEEDAATWAPDVPPALIFSNAALQWLPDHPTLFPHLVSLLARGGQLAVQMPLQHNSPSHRLIHDVAVDLFPGRFDAPREPVAAPETYARLLAPFGDADLWETTYIQRLPAAVEEHPVRLFTQSTFMRPYTSAMDATEEARFLVAYDAALVTAYPPEADGTVLFPFRRLFLTVRRNS
ncbi:methyltransferase domain-containing protein [Vannielia litorea]|uniref:methyltransferase domain-containing protein n=1 Tax=Vannielia litorea TaxID=1217970 RepID=UPI001C93C267|nr:methyltransferase domain-containing protein [Vannielia litorea]MBY6151915.1 methyltransferase domain-containing protein [Vannielia litorea]